MVAPRARPRESRAALEQRVAKLERINAVLIDRVERSIDRQGSAFSLFQTAISLEAQVRSRYYPETEDLLRAATGAQRVLIFDHTIRRRIFGAKDRAAGTPRQLYEELRQRYPFSLPPEMLRVAINSDFGDWDQRLSEGDSVVFIPPVAGG